VGELIGQKVREYGIEATIKGRHKHFYSIYQKMKDQNLTVDQVYDVVAFRVIVNTLKECYEVLGLIHSTWKPIPGKFKDYISLPKANMYQSLHTSVIGPYVQRREVQIRTWEMDKVAEEGIAAHWKYKEGIKIGEVTRSSLHGSGSSLSGRKTSMTRRSSWRWCRWIFSLMRCMCLHPRER
jgi:GTP pyrophosphokinase